MSAPVTLKPEALTKEAFAPFGDVIEIEGAERILINEGTTERFHALTTLDVGDEDGEAILSIFRASLRPMPINIRMMERHPIGSQAFYPLNGGNWLVVVSSATRPGPDNVKAFLASKNQGVQYSKSVWHHPLLILQPNQDFIVADRSGPGENLEEFWFEDGKSAQILL